MRIDEMVREIEKDIRPAIRRGARALQREARVKFNRAAADPSTKGQYPRRVTGELVNSLRVLELPGRHIAFAVGFTADYSKDLEDSGRKMMPEALEEAEAKVVRAIYAR